MPKEEVTKRIGSVGKPVGPTELRIVREDESECDAGEVGEVLTRMSGRQREYYKDEAATANTWTEDGWLRSGDLGYLDDDGFLYLVGRKKDLIIRGGNNVYPTDVEAVLLEHPAVQEAAVIGIPHPVLGEDVAAFVVPRPDAVLVNDEAPRVLRRAARRLQAPAPAARRRRAPPQRHRQGDEAPPGGPGRQADRGRGRALASPAVPDTSVIQGGTWH
jgi:acyl-CoA synthetase (AMP-forming)/AMP-acid ligase II